MTKAQIERLVAAAIRAARKEGVLTKVRVEIVGDEASVEIPLSPDDTPIAEPDEVILPDARDGGPVHQGVGSAFLPGG